MAGTEVRDRQISEEGRMILNERGGAWLVRFLARRERCHTKV